MREEKGNKDLENKFLTKDLENKYVRVFHILYISLEAPSVVLAEVGSFVVVGILASAI